MWTVNRMPDNKASRDETANVTNRLTTDEASAGAAAPAVTPRNVPQRGRWIEFGEGIALLAAGWLKNTAKEVVLRGLGALLSLVLVLLAGGCTGLDSGGAGDAASDAGGGARDMAGLPKTDIARAQTCSWALSMPAGTTGTAAIEREVDYRVPEQCVPLDHLLVLKTRRADGRSDEIELDLRGAGVGDDVAQKVFYRVMVPAGTLPEITCGTWTGRASLASDFPSPRVDYALTCTEPNGGHPFWQADMQAPPTIIAGSFSFNL